MLYQALFNDTYLFPNAKRSQADFIDLLLRNVEKRGLGWNIEGLYLGYLLQELQGRRGLIDTVITTNFDDIISNSFSLIGTRFRLLDHPASILDEPLETSWPRVIHLHGRSINYNVVNSSDDFQLLQLANSGQLEINSMAVRCEAIRRCIAAAAERGGLIVIGYAGWEDVVMKIISDHLAKENCFEAGIVWCSFGGQLRTSVQNMAKNSRRVEIVREVSALDVVRVLAEAIGISDADVLRKIEQDRMIRETSLRRAWIGVQEGRLGWNSLRLESPKDQYSESARFRAEEVSERALSDPRYAALAMEFVNIALLNGNSMEPDDLARLLRCRGDLRLHYSASTDDAIVDFYLSVELSATDQTKALLGMAEAYRHLGERTLAKVALLKAYRTAWRRKDEVGLSRCRFLHARLKFDQNKIYRARQLLGIAIAGFEKQERFDLSSLCFGLLAAISSFNNEGREALGAAARALSHAQRGKSRFAEARAKNTQGYCLFNDAEYSSAATYLHQARRIALEGPDYALLAEINTFLADCEMSQKKVTEAIALLDEAVELFSLLANRLANQQARVWRALYGLHLKPLDKKSIQAAIIVIREFELLEDWSLSTAQWAVLAIDLMSVASDSKIDDDINEAVRCCRSCYKKYTQDLAVTTQDGIGPKGKAAKAEEKLAAHLKEYLILVSELSEIRKVNLEVKPDVAKRLKAMYRDLQKNVELFGSGIFSNEVLALVVGYNLCALEILEAGELILYRGARRGVPWSRDEVAQVCQQSGFWWYADLLYERPSSLPGPKYRHSGPTDGRRAGGPHL